jgi:diguanylate cyclase (GGDEF)-like protein
VTGVDEFFEELRREYLTEAAARLAELRKDLAALVAGEPDAADSLKIRFHRLAGSGGSYGFPDISAVSREAELWIKDNPSPSPEAPGRVEEWVGRLARAFDAAAAEFGLPTEGTVRRAPFGWQALVLGDSSDALVDRVTRSLVDAQYTVGHRPIETDPASVPVSERPDLAVLVPDQAAVGSTALGQWAAPGPTRPSSVLLVVDPEAIDPLTQPYCDFDSLVSPERVETELQSYVQAIGRSASAPAAVLVLEPDEAHAVSLQAAIEGAGGRVTLVASGSALRAALREETPDLILTEWRLPDTSGVALLRFIRQIASHRSTPVVVHMLRPSDDERLAAIRAGADDVLSKAASRTHTVQMIQARIERSRRLRALAHRDDLTGLLNHGSMVEELVSAIGFARRAEETFGLIVLDLDHFRRINEQHGHTVGNRLLAQVARTVVGLVRSSDFVARMGGEEIGVLVRRCSAENCGALAEKIRSAVSRIVVPAGEVQVGVRASAGAACFPDHASTAPDLLRAADRALAQAKAGGRDRLVIGDS